MNMQRQSQLLQKSMCKVNAKEHLKFIRSKHAFHHSFEIPRQTKKKYYWVIMISPLMKLGKKLKAKL